jgi:hypothetical protein
MIGYANKNLEQRTDLKQRADREAKKPLPYLARVWLNLCAHNEEVGGMIASIVDGKKILYCEVHILFFARERRQK